MLAFSNDYYGMIFRATQSVELFCAYFTVDKQKATELFYQQNVKDSLKHSGMGMYISRLYCEKHGGQLLIENEKQSGAVITAVFHRIA